MRHVHVKLREGGHLVGLITVRLCILASMHVRNLQVGRSDVMRPNLPVAPACMVLLLCYQVCAHVVPIACLHASWKQFVLSSAWVGLVVVVGSANAHSVRQTQHWAAYISSLLSHKPETVYLCLLDDAIMAWFCICMNVRVDFSRACPPRFVGFCLAGLCLLG